MTPRPAESFDARRLAALLLAPLVLGLQWYIARPDLVGVRTPEGWWTVTPLAPGAIQSFLAAYALLGVVPALTAWLFGWPLGRLGVRLGRVRPGLRLTMIGVPLAVLAGFIGSRSEALHAVYPLGIEPGAPATAIAWYAAAYFLYYAGFEFFFRGYLMSGVGRPLGPRSANVLQAVLATLAHFGRPAGEFAAALPSSLVFGWLAQRTGSIWYGVVLHWAVGVSLDFFLLNG